MQQLPPEDQAQIDEHIAYMWWTSDRPIWVTADGEHVVPEGDLAAASLLVGEGGRLPRSVAIRLGLVEGR